MTLPLEKMLQDTLGNIDTLSQEKIHELIQEAFKTFTSLKEKANSTDPKEREEAHKIAASLKDCIQTQTEEFSKAAGVDLAAFAHVTENQDLFSPEMWLELSTAKQELEALRNQLGIKKKKTTPVIKKNKAAWLPG